MRPLIIATRGSRLALWQAHHVRDRLRAADPQRDIELLVLKTRGDIILDVPLAKVGGKGLFVKEIEEALLDGRADLAVHSMKDVPMSLPEGLTLGAVLEREDPDDLFLSHHFASLDALPAGARVGTSSLRRQAQVLALRPDLQVLMLRGNVDTRLGKLAQGQYEAIIMASSGIRRLELTLPFEERLAPPRFLPACGQGALGVEFRDDRADLHALCAFLDHEDTRLCVEAERGFLAGLNGGCQTPIAGHAVRGPEGLVLQGLVGAVDGSRLLRHQIAIELPLCTTPDATRTNAATPATARAAAREGGLTLARELLARGGDALLCELLAENPL